MYLNWLYPGADPGFQVRGGGRTSKIFGVFRVKKNHDFTPKTKVFGVFRMKNHDFTPKTKILGVFRVKNHDFTPIIFFPILGGAHAAPWIRPWYQTRIPLFVIYS
jgi:hypothetical protein